MHLIAGMSEIGSGSSTAMVQIAAEVLGVAADAVALVSGDTETTPFDTLTAASRVTVSVGNAVKRAATDARDQLLQLAAERLEANVADLECRDSRIFVKGRRSGALAWGSWRVTPKPSALGQFWGVAPFLPVRHNRCTPLARRSSRWRSTRRPDRWC